MKYLKQIHVVKILFTLHEDAILSLNKNVISISTGPPPPPLPPTDDLCLLSFTRGRENAF